ncbi:hypothetical protein CkaCkLH20_00317 [Colletotrichum karsti]|uniref:Uncharacterized protein n=1 Tax=Colletotrichum karsti TaxID=1095194 RepID=A0A9P6IHD5_9PEZI|nr:uncharacterized protein CkaCkLH20_00317 [Colletotrichum karsti]KAF9882281.1 hypothetical protein CkaCkLH20_00317 [Colletotrichum karsti]
MLRCTPTRSRGGPASPAVALDSYQKALGTLQEKIASLDVLAASNDDVVEVLGAALILTLAGFPRTGQDSTAWSHHIAGLVTLIQLLDLGTIIADPLGNILRESVAYFDITAFSLGRPLRARNAWLRWEIHPPEAVPADDFGNLEVAVGYPKSLLTIIAVVSSFLDNPEQDTALDLTGLVERLYTHATADSLAYPTSTCTSEPDLDCNHSLPPDTFHKIETALLLWQPPTPPKRLSSAVSVALTGAWEIMRKATLLYLWRGSFTMDVLRPLPVRRAALTARYVREMLFGLRTLLAYLESDGITIMNVMTWPLAVIGNECGGDRQTQRKVLNLIDTMTTRFGIQHLEYVSAILQELWRRFEDQTEPSIPLCLESLSKDMGICVPLF